MYCYAPTVCVQSGGKDRQVNKSGHLKSNIRVRTHVRVCVCVLCHFIIWQAVLQLAVFLWYILFSVTSLFQTSFSRGFTKNMKLEAVNPRNPGELCVASVVSVKGRLMWLRLEGTSSVILENVGSVQKWCGADDASTSQKCPFCVPFIQTDLQLFSVLK